MTVPAILCLATSATILWGGLTWSLLRLRRYPDVSHIETGDSEAI
ncbi:MetS family NSS transporter small subunit [Actinomycetaceae bacterium WB03_NA08]|uniref:MetS family NSS transporter small subunit n=1 Tax=Scrofimicrobium canadense TaxID=2652290 RepID=A0A6N7W7V7_9ACTO|nr:MetS family NSS transporter small subunit [Scrofimicrobium canadense]